MTYPKSAGPVNERPAGNPDELKVVIAAFKVDEAVVRVEGVVITVTGQF